MALRARGAIFLRPVELAGFGLSLVAATAGANAPAVVPAPPAEQLLSLDTPVDDCRVTSPYGWRIHPILRRRRFHQGVDFGAPEGTPVHASADGVIEEMDRRGHYGYYLRIRHSGAVQTAYAHLEGFTPGLTVGSAVTRGEVIASVGHTGWATGPHLYYEVIVDGRRVDPRRPGLVVPVPVLARPAEPEPLPLTTSGMP